jgi:acetate---CoA ligase (ADP-forming)
VAVLETVAASGEADAVLMNLHAFVHDTPQIEAQMGRRLADAARNARLPLVVTCRDLTIPGARALVAAGVPVLRDGDAAARLLARLAQPATAPRGVPPLVTAERVRSLGHDDPMAARELLRQAGVTLSRCRVVASLSDAQSAARELGWPVALKAVDVQRKTDVGGVAIELRGPGALEEAWQTMRERLPQSRLAVEPMVRIAGASELLLGVRRDAAMGPVLTLGVGGIHADLIDDHTALLAPVAAGDVKAALQRLHAWPVLAGARGQRGVHVPSVARIAIALVDVLQAHPGLQVIEVNPLLAGPDGAVALDARMERARHD